MNHPTEKVEQLLSKIIKQLAWGEVEQWNNYDFDQLSQMIMDKTKVQLSAITLKRVFGKIKYDSNPSIHTLNTLARFVDYSDWRDFQLNVEQPKPIAVPTPPLKRKTQKNRFKYAFGMFLGIVLVGFLMSGNSFNGDKKYQSEDFDFEYIKIGEGIPSSVVFKYDATKAGLNSTVEIQQNWDTLRREQIQIKDSIHTSIYHYPGYFEAKLVIDNEVVQERGVFIPSNDWITAIENKETPIYVSLDQSKKENILGIEPSFFNEQGFHLQTETTWTNYNFVQKFDVFSDDFSFEANVKNAAVGGANICQVIQSILLFEGDAMIVPMAKLGCVAGLRLYIPDTELMGKTENLSMLGTSTEEWTNFKLMSNQNQLSIYINGKEVKRLPLQMKPRRLIGVRFRFQGTGWVKDIKVNDQVVL